MALTNTERARRWRAANPEKAEASSRKWREANPEKVKAISLRSNRKWLAENHEEHRRATQNWRKRNPEKVRAFDHRRRARKAGAEGSHEDTDIRFLTAFIHFGRCRYCRRTVKLTVDHKVPLCRGRIRRSE